MESAQTTSPDTNMTDTTTATDTQNIGGGIAALSTEPTKTETETNEIKEIDNTETTENADTTEKTNNETDVQKSETDDKPTTETDNNNDTVKTAKGKVKKWIVAKGFGFIEGPDSDSDVFVHRTDIIGKDTLNIGENVEYNVEINPDTGKAKAVMVKGDGSGNPVEDNRSNWNRGGYGNNYGSGMYGGNSGGGYGNHGGFYGGGYG
eukprot:UN29569